MSGSSNKVTTWRQLLRSHGPEFVVWLGESRSEYAALDRISGNLSDFLIGRIVGNGTESRDIALEFWKRIPEVLSSCNDPTTFEKPFAAEAYAYIHLLERYRRTWAALKHLSKVGVLPLGARGVRALDLGTGPAPALYAIDDFYRTLNEFAKTSNLPDLQLPIPELNCVERSPAMVRFFHRFSEFSGRAAPLKATFSELNHLSLKDRRNWHRRQNEYQTFWEPQTQQFEEVFNGWAAEESDALFRYRLVVLSNLLTLESDVETLQDELRALFRDLRPGAVVIVLGAKGNHYPQIYARVSVLAREAGLMESHWHTDELGHAVEDAALVNRIHESQHLHFAHRPL